MKKHLSPQEVVDALGGRLDPMRLEHARTCESCRIQISEFAEVTSDLAAVDVPEPSPLFWNHFSTRVQDALEAGGSGQAPIEFEPWWRGAWRPLAMFAVTAAALALVVVWRPAPSPVALRTGVGVVESAVLGAPQTMSETTFALMQAAVEAPLTWDEARASSLVPQLVSVDAAIEQLTPEQAAELARLIRIEMGGLE
jgi:hypothetical protein